MGKVIVYAEESGYSAQFVAGHLARMGIRTHVTGDTTAGPPGLAEDILAHETAQTPLRGKKILVTAGPTRGRIDAVRYISNRSSGKLGIEIAKKAHRMGADVTLVFGPGTEMPPEYLRTIRVETVGEMREAALKEAAGADAAILAAAVLDYAPKNPAEGKIKSGLGTLTIELEPTEKIVDSIREMHPHLFIVGFKLEKSAGEEELKKSALNLLRRAKLNLVVANNLERIRGESHEALILTAEGGTTRTETKSGLAKELLELVGRRAFTTHLHTSLLPAGSLPKGSEEIAECGRRLESLGIAPQMGSGTYGNISVRTADGFLITGRGVHKGRLREGGIVHVTGVDLEKKEIMVEGAIKASSDAIVHYRIYERFKNVNAIVHAHDELALKWQEALGIPVTREDYPCGTLELAQEVVQAMEMGSYAAMKNHGVIATGSSLREAMGQIETRRKEAEALENG